MTIRRSLIIGGIALLAACSAGRLAEPAGSPVPDPATFEATIREATLPPSPRRLTFAWTLNEGGSRANGRGVVRTEAPERIRLDLFGPRGETYLMAALVDEEYRVPAAARESVALPSPALLWSALGVLAPPSVATLVSATESAAGAELRYETTAGETFAYTFEGGGGAPFRLVRAERAGEQGILETVELARDSTGVLARTNYRNWAEFRDLTLEVESIRQEASFPVSIWSPDDPTH